MSVCLKLRYIGNLKWPDIKYLPGMSDQQESFTEKKKRAKMALLESNFENRYGQPNESPRRAILALFFFSALSPFGKLPRPAPS